MIKLFIKCSRSTTQRNKTLPWRRKWHPTPLLLSGKSHGWRSLVGCSPWGHEESDMTSLHFSLSCTGEGNGNPLQYSCLENPRNGGAWWAAVCGVAQSQTQLKRLSSSKAVSVSCLASVRQFSRSVVSNSATPWTTACQASLSFTISRSLLKLMSIELVMPSTSRPLSSPSIKSFSASGSFLVSLPFSSRCQSTGALASGSVLPMNIQGWFPLRLTGLISVQSKWLSRVFFNTTVWKHQFFSTQPSIWSNFHIHTWLLEKQQLWLYEYVGKVMSLLFNMLSRLFIAFIPRSKHLFHGYSQQCILEPKKIKSVTTSSFSPSICHGVMGLDAIILVF